jgi:hypothetical protein
MRFQIYARTAFLAVALLPASAAAYVGPGAGISLIGSTIGLLVAVGMAIGFVIIWPLRSLFRRRGQPSKGLAAQSRSKAAER